MNARQSAGQVAHQRASDLPSTAPIAMVTSTSAKQTASSKTAIETSGMPIVLNVGFTLWFGASASKSATQAWRPPQLPVQPTAQPVTSVVSAQMPVQPTKPATPAPTSATPATPTALPPYQAGDPIPAVLARRITVGGPVPILKAEATAEQLQAMATSPGMDESDVSDHWIGACGRPWHLAENERERLKNYLDAL